jgi:hypothetical protein
VALGKRRATYEDLAKVPDTMVAELIDGELFTSPRPASPHARVTTVLGSDLLGTFDRPPGDPASPGGWWFLVEPELHLGEASTHAGTDVVRAEPFDAIELRPERWWLES